MDLNTKYIQIVLPSLTKRRQVNTAAGTGLEFSCPFCSTGATAHKATLKPLKAGSEEWMFGCEHGLSKGGELLCRQRMRFQDFLRLFSPPLYRRYLKERLSPAEYRSVFGRG